MRSLIHRGFTQISGLTFCSLLAGLLFCLTTNTPAQTFLMAYGGTMTEQALCVAQTYDGGYIMSGYTMSSSGNMYVIKTDVNGNVQWKRSYGIVNGRGWSIVQTHDSGYIVGGIAGGGSGISDMLLLKLNKNGDSLWARTYGGPGQDDGFSVQQTSDGGYVLAGHTTSFGAGSFDIYLVRTNSNGDTLWTRTYGTVNAEEGYGVRETFDKGFIIIGSFNGTYTAAYLVKTDSTGDPQWGRTYGGNGVERGRHVEQTADSGYIITGESDSFGPGWGEFLLFKTGPSGNVTWAKAIGGATGEKGTCVQQTADGGFILTGNYQDGSGGSYGACLIKTNPSGDTLWTRHFRNVANNFGNYVIQTNDGGYILGGGTVDWGAGSWDALLVKTDNLGNAPCFQHNPLINVTPATLTVTDVLPIVYAGGTVAIPSFSFSSLAS